jgi:hypothetical protein
MNNWLSWQSIVSAVGAFLIGMAVQMFTIGAWKTSVDFRLQSIETLASSLSEIVKSERDIRIAVQEREVYNVARITSLETNYEKILTELRSLKERS